MGLFANAIKIGLICHAYATDVPDGGANATGTLGVGKSAASSIGSIVGSTSIITADEVTMGTVGPREGSIGFPREQSVIRGITKETLAHSGLMQEQRYGFTTDQREICYPPDL